jgi:hypothetical protein
MSKKFFTRLDIQNVLDSNALGAEVSYAEREDRSSPDNYIIYYRLSPNDSLYSDDEVHIRKILVQVTHFHKKKLDSIEGLMLREFNIEPIQFDIKQLDTDFMATYYRFEILTKGAW